MPLPRPRQSFKRFFERLAAAPQRVLMLDFDGTLAPFAPSPQEARPYTGVARLLDEIMQQPGSRVVIVTGRSLEQQPPRLELERLPEMWGAHGWQWRPPAGAPVALDPPPAACERLLGAAARAQPLTRWGARIERKTASVAVHWRGLDVLDVATVRGALGRAWHGFARTRDLQLIDFDGGAELRARGRDKGCVVRDVLGESPTGAVAAYLGDDRSDEDAFAAIRGRGCGVLVRPAWRRTQASHWLRPPEELKVFLERWRDCGRGRH